MQDKKPEEKKRIYSSMFVKMFIAFILIGLIPLLLTGQILYMRLSSSVEEVMISNASQMVVNMGKNVSDLIGKYDDITQSLYDYTSDDYLYFYELLDDTELEEEERERQITNILYNIMNMDRSIQNVRFIYDKIYNVSRDSTKNMDIRKVLDAQWKPREEDLNSLYIMPTHSESNYYYNSEEKVFTMARNYMDVSTMRTAGSRRMGTLYVDFDPSELEILEEGMDMGEDSEVVVADAKDGTVIYSRDSEKVTQKNQSISGILEALEGESGVYRTEDSIYAYCSVENTDWKVLASISRQNIEGMYMDSGRFVLGMLGAAVLILVAFYGFSRYTSRPVRTLKDAMEKMQKGELDTRVDIRSHDEIQVLGEGFNEMADHLQQYIDQVYVAELRQKDAELAALKSTIKPHYLYNTLEVIRMTAISENAEKASRLIDSLSKQLRYLIGNESDQVTLKEELENIREYFYIVKVRYENLYDLEMDVPADCLHLKVLKLILQPAIENAVKHGLRPKKGAGKVRISVLRRSGCLCITVMDDGVGMPEEKVQEITDLLGKDTIGSRKGETISIGIKNTYDRIVKNYGNSYGFQITSCENLGTIVEYTLPVLEE